MSSKSKSLLQRIKDHWIYAIVAVVFMSASVTFSAVQVLIVGPLRYENERLYQEIARLSKEREPRQPLEGPGSAPARTIEEQHVYRTYEWQWAGEQWYGWVTLAKRNGKNVITFAKVGVLEKRYDDRGGYTFEMGDVILELAKEGTFEINDGQLAVDFMVDKRVRGSDVPARQRITGSLHSKVCWAGDVTYWDFAKKTEHPGGMVLSGHISLNEHSIREWMANASIHRR